MSLALQPSRSFKSTDVFDTLSAIVGGRGAPTHVRSDNGSEFIAQTIKCWMAEIGFETLYIEPGSPWQNGYVESFNSRLRAEILEMNYFNDLNETRTLARQWKERNNTRRPQAALGKTKPQEFAR